MAVKTDTHRAGLPHPGGSWPSGPGGHAHSTVQERRSGQCVVALVNATTRAPTARPPTRRQVIRPVLAAWVCWRLSGGHVLGRSLSLETMHVASRLAQGAQTILETVDSVVSSSVGAGESAGRELAPPLHTCRVNGCSSVGSHRQRKARKQPVISRPSDATWSKMANQPRSYQEGLQQGVLFGAGRCDLLRLSL